MSLWINRYLFILRLPLTSILSRIDIINMNGINSEGYSYLFTGRAVTGNMDKWLWVPVHCSFNVSHFLHVIMTMLISQTSTESLWLAWHWENKYKDVFVLMEFRAELRWAWKQIIRVPMEVCSWECVMEEQKREYYSLP